MGKYNVTIGLEMHCEVSKTNSKELVIFRYI